MCGWLASGAASCAFVVEVVDGLDLSAMSGRYRGSGSALEPVSNLMRNEPDAG